MNLVSIICPIYNEEKYIEDCILSVLSQDYPQECLEILFIDGMSTDNTRVIVSSYASKYNNIRLIDNPDRIVPPALNKGIAVSKGDYVIRLDAHCKYPTNYVSKLISYAEKLNCENVGAVCKTLPADGSDKALSIAIGMSHKFGVGGSSFRVGSNELKKVDTVPFGCFKRSIFDQLGGFDNDLTRNQDDEFNGRIIKNGGSIYLIPDLIIDYYARNSFSKVFRMFYQYGLYKPLVNKKLGSPATLRQFVPLLFVIGLIFGGVLSFCSKYLFYIYISVVLLYLLLLIYISVSESLKNKRWGIMFSLPIVFLCMHIGYGWGYLRGIYKILMKKSFNVQINR